MGQPLGPEAAGVAPCRSPVSETRTRESLIKSTYSVPYTWHTEPAEMLCADPLFSTGGNRDRPGGSRPRDKNSGRGPGTDRLLHACRAEEYSPSIPRRDTPRRQTGFFDE